MSDILSMLQLLGKMGGGGDKFSQQMSQQWNPAAQYMPQMSLLGGKQPQSPAQFQTGAIPGIQNNPNMPQLLPGTGASPGIFGKGGAKAGGG